MSDPSTLDKRSAAGCVRFERSPGGAWILRTTQCVPVARSELFPFFADAANLRRITPSDMRFEIVSEVPITMREGALIDYRLRAFGLPLRWRTIITRWDPPSEFVDEQLRGPYAEWVHRHRFREDEHGGTVMEDHVLFRLPLGRLGALGAPLVRRQLRRIFAFRRAMISRLAEAYEAPDGRLVGYTDPSR